MSDIIRGRAPDAPEPPGRELQQLPLLDPVRARVSWSTGASTGAGRTRCLLVASYVFYGAWDYRFLFLILLSTVIDFIGGLGVAGVELPARKRRNLGVLLIGSSILLTAGIRYDLLFAGDVAAALPLHARDWAIPLATAVCDRGVRGLPAAPLPAPHGAAAKGVPRHQHGREPRDPRLLQVLRLLHRQRDRACSTRSALGTPSWTTLHPDPPGGDQLLHVPGDELHDRHLSAATRADRATSRDFALFVCFFPHLVAGPIMRAHTLAAAGGAGPRDPRGTPGMREGLDPGAGRPVQEAGDRRQHGAARERGVLPLSRRTRRGRERRRGRCSGIYAFALQIYGDFSGYSAIARGISKWLGFELVDELPPALPGAEPERLLAALAHQPLHAGCATTSTSRWAATGAAWSRSTAT